MLELWALIKLSGNWDVLDLADNLGISPTFNVEDFTLH